MFFSYTWQGYLSSSSKKLILNWKPDHQIDRERAQIKCYLIALVLTSPKKWGKKKREFFYYFRMFLGHALNVILLMIGMSL